MVSTYSKIIAAWLGAAVLALGVVGIRGCYKDYTGEVVYRGKIKDGKVEFVRSAGGSRYNHDELRIYGKNGELKAIFKDSRWLGREIDGDVDSIFIFDSRGRKKTIDKIEIIDYDGAKYSWGIDDEATTALLEGQKSLEKANELYKSTRRKIYGIEGDRIKRAKKAGSLDLNLGE